MDEKPKSPGDIQAEEKLKKWMEEIGLKEGDSDDSNSNNKSDMRTT